MLNHGGFVEPCNLSRHCINNNITDEMGNNNPIRGSDHKDNNTAKKHEFCSFAYKTPINHRHCNVKLKATLSNSTSYTLQKSRQVGVSDPQKVIVYF